MESEVSSSGLRYCEFGPYAVDRLRGVLTRAGAVVPLRPKAWEVLLLLIDRRDQLLSVDAILDSVWSDVAVTPKTLSNVIVELRHALADDSNRPHYIETVHRRGYRFIGFAAAASPSPALSPLSALVGRSRELHQLDDCWKRACNGKRQVVYIAGEPGVGKTRLVNEFSQFLQANHPRAKGSNGHDAPLLATGQCFERHGAYEAYMPVLDAISSIATGATSNLVRGLLERNAPTWLEQIPWLVPPAERTPKEPSIRGFGAARMLREGAQFFSALAEQRPVALVLEDLHWADPETIDLIAALSRPHAARILLIGTYRVAEARLERHPLIKVVDDAGRAGATRISLENFSGAEVHAYLEQRFPGSDIASELTAFVENHSGGNPLFVRAAVDHLIESGQLTDESGRWRVATTAALGVVDLPDTIRGVIDAQIALLDPFARDLLGVAAVAGESCTVGSLSAGLDAAPEEVESTVDSLVRQSRFVVSAKSARPTAIEKGQRLEFVHALYQRVLYERLAPPQRRRVHQRIGEYLERVGAADANPAVVADHFDRSLDHARAALYFEQCATAAARRMADRERLLYLERAAFHIEHAPAGANRSALELRIFVGIGEAVSTTAGPHDERVAGAVTRVIALCNEVDDPPALYVGLHGLLLYSTMRGDFITNRPLLDRATRLAQTTPRPELRMLAEMQVGIAACFRGDPGAGRKHLEAAAAHAEQVDEHWLPVTLPDARVEIRSALAWSLWLVGCPDQALQYGQESFDQTIDRRDVVSSIVAAVFLCNVSILRGEFDRALDVAQELRLLGDEFEMDLARGTGLLLEAAVLIEKLQIDAAFQIFTTSGLSEGDPGLQQMVRTYYLTRLARACGRTGNPQQGLMLLGDADARIVRSGSPISESEVWRIRGELAHEVDAGVLVDLGLVTVEDANPEQYAEACLQRALAITRRQAVRSLELRAATSLARLWQGKGRAAEAYGCLQPVYSAFQEGFGTADLCEARELLDQLHPASQLSAEALVRR